jgi:hypothetical protein
LVVEAAAAADDVVPFPLAAVVGDGADVDAFAPFGATCVACIGFALVAWAAFDVADEEDFDPAAVDAGAEVGLLLPTVVELDGDEVADDEGFAALAVD